MNRQNDRFAQWIFNSYSVNAEGLGLYRIFFALFALFFLLPSTGMYPFLGGLPDQLFAPPPGPMWLFDGFPPEAFFWLCHSVLILSLASLLMGFKTKLSSLSVGITLLIIKGFFYSLGKINHDLLLSVVPLVMAFSGWGAAYSVDAWRFASKENKKNVESWPLTLLALFIGFMMFTAGFAKLLGGWLDPQTQATMGHFFKQYFVNGRQDLLAEQIMTFDNRIVWELLDYATLAFEMGFLAAVVYPKSTRLFVCFAVLFHFSVMMMLNISFLPNFPAYAAFISWSAFDSTSKKWIRTKFAAPILLIGLFLVVGSFIWIGYSMNFPDLQSDLPVYEFYIVLAALPIALYYIGRQVITLLSQLKSLSIKKVS